MIELPFNARYHISNDGKVLDTHRNKYVSQYSNGLGYIAVKLQCNGERKQFYVHRLVAECYLGSCHGSDVNHIDGNKSNNSVYNLEIVSHSENMKHAFENKLLKGFISKHYN